MKHSSVDVLKKLLADTFAVYLKTLNYHWNIKNTNNFYEFHKLLEMQYQELALALDDIAEEITTYNQNAPAGMAELQKLASIKDGNSNKSALEMIVELADDHLKIRSFLDKNQTEVDYTTNDLLCSRAKAHSKAAWMLNSSIE